MYLPIIFHRLSTICTGFTSNLKERLLPHNELGSGWTARLRPWKVIYTNLFNDKNEAMQQERWLKSAEEKIFIKISWNGKR